MSNDFFQPSTVMIPAPKRGPMVSADFNTFQDLVVADFSRLARLLNDMVARLDSKLEEIEDERKKLQAFSQLILEKQVSLDKQSALAGQSIYYSQSFRDISNIDFTGVATARCLRVEPTYGQTMLPYNRCVSLLYSKNPTTDELIAPQTVNITASPVNEGSGDIKAGNTAFAIDGDSEESWVRKVIFPMEDDQQEVSMDVDIDVPTLFASDCNMLTLIPSPAGEVDILSILYSTSTSDPSIPLPGFTEVDSCGAYRIHFSSLEITKLRIRLRQRHFTFESGEKVFQYGIKELGLFLVDIDKTTGGSSTPTNIVQFAITCPSGYKFNTITSFFSSPTYATGVADNKIYFRIYKDAARGTSPLWTSFTDTVPSIGSPLSILSQNVSTIYVVVYLDWDAINLLSPVLNSFSMSYTVAGA